MSFVILFLVLIDSFLDNFKSLFKHACLFYFTAKVW